ncbi:ABC transporter ATP-binding protein [Gammaproteobacteria bacterium]|nr:ABC transporter ATP-binding protein [Gammaproteobacteria bacterium]MDB4816099.1 ABC transporter ATP-binding protein [Gammaproteobacteria bacterium]MDC0591260.1 ABC transporter ATP-binding protein [Gammaproteobacteria bacterium]MDC1251275.1 ABC transporter ATP-binding protein [Gammaproteobacteria bacterium]MDC3323409.1 ABC transporter ATP-binding protein [Gammaproteobacteria bacterium]
MSSPILEVQNISKIFEANDSSLTVLDNFSLSLDKGESLGLIGASGSGKSTLLHIICGLEQPNSGKVIVKGESITELNSDERSIFRNKEIGFVYQFHHLLSELSTLENIALPAMLSGKSKDEALSKAQTLLSKVNLAGKEKNNPNQLSGGERQRVAIARSMSNDPSFLIMDEPTGNLDSQNVQNFMDLLMNMISEQDITLIIATHDQNVSSRLNKLLSLE